jgi:hypothetical protein
MGISLGDIASFATGVVKADEKATQERLKDRRAELQADRQFYIDMKTKKYESELKSFEEENKKYKAIQAVNAKFEGQDKVDPTAYGKAYLQETNPTLLYQYETLYADNPALLNSKLSTFADASIRDYKTTTTRDSLDTKLKQDVDAITADYKTQLENAKGDSKLINAIIGKRDKKIADTIQENENSKNGVVKAKEIAVETDTDSKPTFEFGEVKEVDFVVPKKFKDKVEPLRIKLNDNTEIKKENVNINLTFFSENDIAVPKQFLSKDTDGNTTGLKGPGNTFVNQTNSLANQAVKTLTNESLYASTGGDSSLISNDFNPNKINGMVSDRLANYSVVSSDKKDGFFSDRNNIVAIVPFSIVDNNNTLGGYQFVNKGQTKAVGEAYLQALKNIDATNNPEGSIERSQKYLNDFQNKLLRTNPGEQTKEVQAVQNEMLRILTEKGIIKSAPNKENENETSSNINTGQDQKTMQVEINGKPVTMIDNTEVRNMLAEDIQKGENIKIIDNIKQEEKIIDSATNENVTTPVKKTPADFGQINQPVFETLESILKVIDMPMTGEEIKNTFDISPGLKINSKTVFRPLS